MRDMVIKQAVVVDTINLVVGQCVHLGFARTKWHGDCNGYREGAAPARRTRIDGLHPSHHKAKAKEI